MCQKNGAPSHFRAVLSGFRFLVSLGTVVLAWLPLKDSNLEQQSQNLLCYHYTKG